MKHKAEPQKKSPSEAVVRNRAAMIVTTASLAIPFIACAVIFLKPNPAAPPMTVGARLGGSAVFAVMEMLFWQASRMRTVATARGITIYGFMRKIDVPWDAVQGFVLRNAVRVSLRDGRSLPIPGFMAGPGSAAIGNPAGVKALRKLEDLRGERDLEPMRPGQPPHYRPYVNVYVLISSFAVFVLMALAARSGST